MITVDEIKTKFINDCSNEKYSSQYIVQKYLCNGSSPILDDETIFKIKHKISCEFNIHPNEVILTGSGKLGFSIAPRKELNNFNEGSDIDVAIVSPMLFDRYWQELLEFNINTTNRTNDEQTMYNNFINYLFKGWIRPDKFPFRYTGKQNWFEFFNTLTSEIYQYGEHKIAAGIYKNFATFELYNMKTIDEIRNKIKAGIIYG